MAFATLAEYNAYTQKFDDDVLAAIYLGSAEDVIKAYLGYNPESLSYDERLDGSGARRQRLASKPIIALTSVEFDGVSQDVADFYLKNEWLTYSDTSKTFPRGDENIHVTYTAGYAVLPEVIKLTCLRIAALMSTEAEGNIGITSKSFGDSGTRTFIQTTKYDRYLAVLNDFRITRL